MNAAVRIGLIGTSGWAADFHLPALQSHDATVVAAVCGRDRQRAAAFAHQHGVEQVYTNYQSMIDEAELDAVSVVTPEDLHHPMVMAALRAGLHVLCEKPMALSAAESAEMLAAAESAGVKHMVQFTNRGLPHYRYVKSLLDDGYVGQPYHGYFYWPTGWGRSEEVNNYHWASDARRAKGAVSELGAHMIDVARCYMGDVVRVSAASARRRPRASGRRERTASAHVRAQVPAARPTHRRRCPTRSWSECGRSRSPSGPRVRDCRGMVADPHGQPTLGRIQGRTPRHRPGDEDVVDLEPQVEMERAGVVAVDHESQRLGGRHDTIQCPRSWPPTRNSHWAPYVATPRHQPSELPFKSD